MKALINSTGIRPKNGKKTCSISGRRSEIDNRGNFIEPTSQKGHRCLFREEATLGQKGGGEERTGRAG